MAEWRAIDGMVGRFAVSDEGEVMAMNFAKSGLPGVLKPNLARGYNTVQLADRKRYTIHRLVAAAFIGPRPAGMQINHINGIKTDNRVANLEYVTPSENRKHSFRIGLESNKGEQHSQARLTDEKVREIRRYLKIGMRVSALARMYEVHQSLISHIKSGRLWSHVKDEEELT